MPVTSASAGVGKILERIRLPHEPARRRGWRYTVCALALVSALLGGLHLTLMAQSVTIQQTCNPETNPDCDAGGGGGGTGGNFCPVNCTTKGVTIGTVRHCDSQACSYHPLLDQWLYAGTQIVYREGRTPQPCQINVIQCWSGLGCGGCVP